jgi:hypothetical protein
MILLGVGDLALVEELHQTSVGHIIEYLLRRSMDLNTCHKVRPKN